MRTCHLCKAPSAIEPHKFCLACEEIIVEKLKILKNLEAQVLKEDEFMQDVMRYTRRRAMMKAKAMGIKEGGQ